MPITSISRYFVGNPNIVSIVTTDDINTITTNGYISSQKESISVIQNGEFEWTETDLVVIYYFDSQIGLFRYDATTDSFQQNSATGGGVVLPTVANRIAHFTNDDGIISSDAADVTNIGDIIAGESGNGGSFISNSDSSGSLRLSASDVSSGDYQSTITNDPNITQDQIYTIPDTGSVGSARFLIDTGPSTVFSYEQSVPLTNFQTISPSDWGLEKISDAEWSWLKSANNLGTYAIDITNQISLHAGYGFSLSSIDIQFSISGANLVSHDIFLYKIVYIDNQIPTVTNIALNSDTLPIADRTNIYVVNKTIVSPGFNNTSNSKYVLEVTVNNTGSQVYRYFGINLKFDRTIP